MTVVFWLSFAALWALVLFQTFVLMGLTGMVQGGAHSGIIEGADDGLQGKPAPAFSAADLSGSPISNADLAGRPAALLFVSPDCEHCAVTLAELEALESKTNGTVIVLCRSDRGRCLQLAQTYGLRVPVIVDDGFALSRLFRVTGAPTAVLLRADGVIESYGRPMGPRDLEETVKAAGWDAAIEDDDLEALGEMTNGGVVVHVRKGG
jgi:peroxiredoxin